MGAYHSGFMMGGWCCVCCWDRRRKQALRLWRDARWSSGDRGGWLVEVKGASAGQGLEYVREGQARWLDFGLGWEDGMGGGSAGHVQRPVSLGLGGFSSVGKELASGRYLDAIIRYEAVPLAVDWRASCARALNTGDGCWGYCQEPRREQSVYIAFDP